MASSSPGPSRFPAKPLRTASRLRGGGRGCVFLAAITLCALLSQLLVAGGYHVGRTARRGRSLLGGLLSGNRHEAAKLAYRAAHSHEVVVAEAELQCSGQLTPEVQGMLAYARKQEGVLAAALEQQQPRFLANATGGTKRCRGAPAGHEVPRLHRVGLLLPPGTRQRAAAAAAAAKQPRRRQLLLNTDALAAAALRSAAGGGPASGSRPADISVVTQLSLDRLPALARQCASWRGPLIAVVYAPLVGGRVALLLEQAHVAAAADPRLAALDGGTPLEALQYVRAQHRRISSRPGGCQLTLELVVEERCSLPLAGLWPINANRNRALMLADTPAVALLDVDFLVAGQLSPWLGEQPAGDGIGGGTGSSTASSSSQGDHRQVGETPRDTSSSSSSSSSSGVALAMGQQLTGSGGGAAAAARSTATGMVRRLAAALYASEAALRGSSPDDAWLAALLADGEAQGRSWLEAVLSQNAAVVLPAFEANTTSLGRGIRATLAAAMASKAGMAALVTERRLCSFQQRQYPRGHHATRVRWWVRTQEPYAVDYWQGYEPFLLLPISRMPFYDERFRGYGFDKQEGLVDLVRQLGAKLVVHPTAWLLHQPHKHSAAQSLSRATGQRAKLHDLWVDVRRSILNRAFVPSTAYHHLCRRDVRAA